MVSKPKQLWMEGCTVKKVGLIGLGNIGQFYTQELVKAGYPLLVYDLVPEKLRSAVEKGGVAATGNAQIAKECDIIVLSLPGSHVVEPVLDAMLPDMHEGQLVIDTSTCRPSTDERYEKILEKHGIGLIDAPLSWRQLKGGGMGQILMCGGKPENFAKAEEVLKVLSYKYKLVGKIGDGQVLKAVNQAVLADMLAVNCEAVEMMKKHELDPVLLRDFLEFNIHAPLYSGDYQGGGHLVLHYKDLGYLLEIAHESGAQIPISSLVHEMFKTTKIYGEPNWYQVGIQTYYKRLNNEEMPGKKGV